MRWPHERFGRLYERGKKVNRRLLLAMAVGLSLGGTVAAPAAAVNLIGDNTGGFGGESWHTASDWSNNAVPTADNDYYVGNSTGKLIMAQTGAATFAGGSLTIYATGTLQFRTASPSVSRLTLEGGSLSHALSGLITLGGTTLTVSAPSVINAANADGRDFAFSAALTGSGALTLNGANTGNEFRFSSGSSTYSGDWTVNTGYLRGIGNHSLGSGNITIGAGARLDADYAINNRNSSLTLNGEMVLDQSHTFGSVIIGGTKLAVGTYTFTQLNTAYDAYFVNGGTGSITVVPEPQLVGLGVVGMGVLAAKRRRVHGA